jgi:hypothetical protein
MGEVIGWLLYGHGCFMEIITRKALNINDKLVGDVFSQIKKNKFML